VAAITLQFENQLDEDVYVDWPGSLPHFALERDTATLMTNRVCIPMCGSGCECSSCIAPAGQVRRVPAGETLTVVWEPVHYAVNACGSGECECVETWPVTAGHYSLSLSAYTNAEGGEPAADNPLVLIGASPSPGSRTCTSRGEFDLAGGATVKANFICP
jgi:hypothetical protein